jgi:DNA replication protein DnaC
MNHSKAGQPLLRDVLAKMLTLQNIKTKRKITMNEQLLKMAKYLRLTGLINNWEYYQEIVLKDNLSHIRFIEFIIEEEYKIKKENSRILRIKKAKIPEQLTIETFPFEKQPKMNKNIILNLYDNFDYVNQKRNIIWIGPTGVGKTGLATSFLMQAINRGYKGRFIHFFELMEMLYKSIADHSEEKLINCFANYDCLLVDEVGYVEAEPVQVGLFFTLMHKRHRNKSTLITTNLGFEQWNIFFKNEHLTAALIDRLTENSHVINMKECISLRGKAENILV